MGNESISCALRSIGIGLILALFATAGSAASSSDAISTVPFTTAAIEPAEYNGDVRDLPPEYARSYYHLWNEFAPPMPQRPPPGPGISEPVNAAPVMLAPMPAATRNFAGLAFNSTLTRGPGTAGAGWPPDTNGDVGPVYYIQAVNDAFGIFNKSTGAVVASFSENQLWSGAGTGTACDANNQGDSIAIHDGLADRWVLTNFAFGVSGGNPVAPFYQCIAVSKTSDPVAGGWWFYAVRMDSGASGAPPAGTFTDYPKFGLWTDCLYMGANGFNNATGNYAGPVFAAFNRTALYAGTALSSSNSSLGFMNDATIFGMFPADLQGTSAASQPPSGTPEYFVDESGTAFAFDVRKFQSGANACGAGSTLGAATSVSQASYGYPADVANTTTDIVSQPGTTIKLDSLGDELMQRVVYRKIGSVESLWVVHTTCGTAQSAKFTCSSDTSSRTQPQWAQINVTNKTVATTPVQQQIYAPDTTLYRWMGSLAVDGQGNMAIGYSRSNGTNPNFPSIAYSGRLATDPANQLPQTETVLVSGAGSQTNNCGSGGAPCDRWGDYSAMAIDPADDCTFWYTTEYYDTAAHGSSGTWQTRIGAFRFPSCIGPAAKLVFTQAPNASYASGAAITVKVSVEDAVGNIVTSDTSAVTLALSGGTAGAVLGGTKTVNAIAGVATFSNLSVDKVGTNYVLNATDGTLTGAASTPFNITVGAAKTVTFTTQPAASSNIAAGAPIPLVAHVVDGGGNPVPSQSIALTILNNPGSSILSVTTNPVTTNVGGDATFANVSLNKVGSGYTLKATDTTTPSATPATSNAFNIVAGAAAKLVFTIQPANVVRGTTLATVAVAKEDALGNVITSDSTSVVSFTVIACGGPVALGSATLSNGIGTLTGSSRRFYIVASGLNVTATSASFTTNSNSFSVVANADLVFSDGFDGCRL